MSLIHVNKTGKRTSSIDLYNQGKTIREIAKEIRMSFRDIGAILKKEEKENERQKRQLKNNIVSSGSDNDQRG